MTIRSGVLLSLERARDLLHAVSVGLLTCRRQGINLSLFRCRHRFGTPSGTTIVNMDSEAILKVNLEDLPDDQKALIKQAIEEFREKCLLSYSRMSDFVIHKTLLPSVLLHGKSEDVEARTNARLVHKTVHKAFTNHNKVLANTVGNVLKEVFFGALVDQVGPAYFNGFNSSAVGSNEPGSS